LPREDKKRALWEEGERFGKRSLDDQNLHSWSQKLFKNLMGDETVIKDGWNALGEAAKGTKGHRIPGKAKKLVRRIVSG